LLTLRMFCRTTRYNTGAPCRRSAEPGDPMSESQAQDLAGDQAPTALSPAGPEPVLRVAADEPAADERVAARSYRRRVLLVLAGLVLAFGLYWGSSYVFAYTDDAYVTSDLVAVAPQITGRVVAVPIVDNETVTKGTLLFRIDPTPFRLALAEQQGKLAEAEAQLAVDHQAIKAAKAARDEAAGKAKLAVDDLRRDEPVAAAGFLSQQALEQAKTKATTATATLSTAEDAVNKEREVQDLHRATVKALTARIGYLEWQLAQTRVVAPTDGTITALTLRVGDQAVANQPLVGLVDAHAWRVFANYKEGVIRHIRVGDEAWVWLDTYPWHFHRAVIQGIARGISRRTTPNTLLPYVAPTTDWIRLERRFPVTLVLKDLPSPVVLHMGSDARTLIFY
jgi:membrane fusion protein, multidrug efflux system